MAIRRRRREDDCRRLCSSPEAVVTSCAPRPFKFVCVADRYQGANELAQLVLQLARYDGNSSSSQWLSRVLERKRASASRLSATVVRRAVQAAVREVLLRGPGGVKELALEDTIQIA